MKGQAGARVYPQLTAKALSDPSSWSGQGGIRQANDMVATLLLHTPQSPPARLSAFITFRHLPSAQSPRQCSRQAQSRCPFLSCSLCQVQLSKLPVPGVQPCTGATSAQLARAQVPSQAPPAVGTGRALGPASSHSLGLRGGRPPGSPRVLKSLKTPSESLWAPHWPRNQVLTRRQHTQAPRQSRPQDTTPSSCPASPPSPQALARDIPHAETQFLPGSHMPVPKQAPVRKSLYLGGRRPPSTLHLCPPPPGPELSF